MNEFSKEELRNLLKLYLIADDAKLISRLYDFYQLEIKLLTMIKNFCDHEKTVGCLETKVIECLNCKKVFSYDEFEKWQTSLNEQNS